MPSRSATIFTALGAARQYAHTRCARTQLEARSSETRQLIFEAWRTDANLDGHAVPNLDCYGRCPVRYRSARRSRQTCLTTGTAALTRYRSPRICEPRKAIYT